MAMEDYIYLIPYSLIVYLFPDVVYAPLYCR